MLGDFGDPTFERLLPRRRHCPRVPDHSREHALGLGHELIRRDANSSAG
jgi:hypothetical protein